jgi:hypothetical protein
MENHCSASKIPQHASAPLVFGLGQPLLERLQHRRLLSNLFWPPRIYVLLELQLFLFLQVQVGVLLRQLVASEAVMTLQPAVPASEHCSLRCQLFWFPVVLMFLLWQILFGL